MELLISLHIKLWGMNEEGPFEEGGLGDTVHTYTHSHFVLSLIFDDNIFVPHDSTVWASSPTQWTTGLSCFDLKDG